MRPDGKETWGNDPTKIWKYVVDKDGRAKIGGVNFVLEETQLILSSKDLWSNDSSLMAASNRLRIVSGALGIVTRVTK